MSIPNARASAADQASLANYVTVNQAAAALAVDPKTIRRRLADGSLEGRRFGTKLVRISAASLEAFGRPSGGGF